MLDSYLAGSNAFNIWTGFINQYNIQMSSDKLTRKSREHTFKEYNFNFIY